MVMKTNTVKKIEKMGWPFIIVVDGWAFDNQFVARSASSSPIKPIFTFVKHEKMKLHSKFSQSFPLSKEK